MQKKSILLFFLLLILQKQSTFSQQGYIKKQHLRVYGYLHNANIKKVYISYTNNFGELVYTEAPVKKKKFQFAASVTTITKVRFCKTKEKLLSNNSPFVYLNNATWDIEILGENLEEIVVGENFRKHDSTKILALKSLIVNKKDSLITEIQKIKKGGSAIENKKETLLADMYKGLDLLEKEELEVEIKFIKENPTSFLIPTLLLRRIYKQPGLFAIDSISALFNIATDIVKLNKEGQYVSEIIKLVKNTQAGRKVPDFEYLTSNGELTKFSYRFNKKYVLIDFWASWCLPCRAEFPELIQLYSTYSDKGFEILSISTDKDTSKYNEAIKKEKILMWDNILINAEIVKKFYIPVLPTKYLIDTNGNIIARTFGGGEENINVLKKTLSEKL